jgi:hypothetical protein
MGKHPEYTHPVHEDCSLPSTEVPSSLPWQLRLRLLAPCPGAAAARDLPPSCCRDTELPMRRLHPMSHFVFPFCVTGTATGNNHTDTLIAEQPAPTDTLQRAECDCPRTRRT